MTHVGKNWPQAKAASMSVDEITIWKSAALRDSVLITKECTSPLKLNILYDPFNVVSTSALKVPDKFKEYYTDLNYHKTLHVSRTFFQVFRPSKTECDLYASATYLRVKNRKN